MPRCVHPFRVYPQSPSSLRSFQGIKNFHFYDYFCVFLIYCWGKSDDNLNYYYTSSMFGVFRREDEGHRKSCNIIYGLFAVRGRRAGKSFFNCLSHELRALLTSNENGQNYI